MNRVESVLAQWLACLKTPLGNCQLIVAYSGGRDSHVLLKALCILKTRFNDMVLRAVHINHGLQPKAPEWALHCQHVAAKLNVPYETLCLDLKPIAGLSVEEAARDARYLAFKTLLKPHHYLLTAHTQDDQAETVLLQLMRGAGPKGLCAMPHSRRLGEGYLVRPLLSVSRQEIAEYATEHHLQWVEDPSNEELRFSRNFLRHEVLKPMQTAFPSVSACIARSAGHVADMQALLEEYVRADLLSCQDKNGMLKLNVLRTFAATKQMAILKEWLNFHQIRSPSTRVLNTILQQALTAKRDAKVSIRFGKVTLYRYQETLYWQSQTQQSISSEPVLWDLSQPLSWGGSRYKASQVKGRGLFLGADAILTVKMRQGGERCRIDGEKMTRSLKKIFQLWQIPFWQRSKIPLFYEADKLVGIGDRLLGEGAQAGPHEQGWVIEKVK